MAAHLFFIFYFFLTVLSKGAWVIQAWTPPCEKGTQLSGMASVLLQTKCWGVDFWHVVEIGERLILQWFSCHWVRKLSHIKPYCIWKHVYNPKSQPSLFFFCKGKGDYKSIPPQGRRLLMFQWCLNPMKKSPKTENTISVFLLNFKDGLQFAWASYYRTSTSQATSSLQPNKPCSSLPPIILNPEPHRIRKEYCVKTDKGLKYYK